MFLTRDNNETGSKMKEIYFFKKIYYIIKYSAYRTRILSNIFDPMYKECFGFNYHPFAQNNLKFGKNKEKLTFQNILQFRQQWEVWQW